MANENRPSIIPETYVELTDELRHQLDSVSTATLAGQLQGRGLRSTFLSGLKPTRPELRLLGHAHTLRYVPLREDLPRKLGNPNAQRVAVEGVGPDEVLVIEARGEADAGTIGDIFTMRALRRGATGIITDGALRDTPAITALDIPVYHQSSHAATLGRLHTPLETQVVISCAGVTIVPGDVLVGDAEGVVVIPSDLVVEVAAAAYSQEQEEEFALQRVAEGASSIGYFPLAKENRAEFEAWLAERQG
ncbi:MAG: hypothetical protein OEY23_26245 [Acidimicrobiia bacterium]|nr:hypothetical protein [Acidimicrobiia bacterium]